MKIFSFFVLVIFDARCHAADYNRVVLATFTLEKRKIKEVHVGVSNCTILASVYFHHPF